MTYITCKKCNTKQKIDTSLVASLLAQQQWKKKPFSSKEMSRRAKLMWAKKTKNIINNSMIK